MDNLGPATRHRILVIDDNPAIHEDFRKILCQERHSDSKLAAAEAVLFGGIPPLGKQSEFEVDSAYQAEQGLALVTHALQAGRPYEMAFVDVRMPPGWDGLEVTPKLWVADPDLQIVICTAYSDYSWEQMFARIGTSDRMYILRKPFEREEVLQLAHSLTEKRRLSHESALKQRHLEKTIRAKAELLERTSKELQTEIFNLRRDNKGVG